MDTCNLVLHFSSFLSLYVLCCFLSGRVSVRFRRFNNKGCISGIFVNFHQLNEEFRSQDIASHDKIS